MTQQEQLVAWLNDAHQLEEQVVRVLDHHHKDAEGYPDVQAMIAQHLEESKGHADLVKGRIEALGGSVSGVKSALGAMMGAITGPVADLQHDTIIKNSIIEYSTEHLEMAWYRVIRASAEALGDHDTVAVVDKIYAEEHAMEEKLEHAQPGLTKQFLATLDA